MPKNAATKVSQEKLTTLQSTVAEQFKLECEALMGPRGLKKNQVKDLIAGHQDGMRSIIMALRAQGLIEVED